MIQIKWTGLSEIDPLFAGEEYMVAHFQEEVGQMIEEAYGDVEAPFYADLQYQPSQRTYPDEYPIQWASPQQKFAAIRHMREKQGNRQQYERTDQMVEGWQITPSAEAGRFTILVRNSTPYTRWVVGGLGKGQTYLKGWQFFHQQTIGGRLMWNSAHETVAYWFEVIENEVRQKFNARLGILRFRTTARGSQG